MAANVSAAAVIDASEPTLLDAGLTKVIANRGWMQPPTHAPYELNVETAWASCLEAATPAAWVQTHAAFAGWEVWDMHGLLSPNECENLLTAAEDIGFGRTSCASSPLVV